MSGTVRDLDGLRALRETDRRGSIAAAATALGVTQQALSARMRNLERALQVTLLTRTPAGSQLTEQGRLVVGWAEDVLTAAERLEAGLRSIRSGVSHRLAVAASQTIAEYLVPHWLVELRASGRGHTKGDQIVRIGVLAAEPDDMSRMMDIDLRRFDDALADKHQELDSSAA